MIAGQCAEFVDAFRAPVGRGCSHSPRHEEVHHVELSFERMSGPRRNCLVQIQQLAGAIIRIIATTDPACGRDPHGGRFTIRLTNDLSPTLSV